MHCRSPLPTLPFVTCIVGRSMAHGPCGVQSGHLVVVYSVCSSLCRVPPLGVFRVSAACVVQGAPNSDASIGLLMPCYPSTLQHVPKPWTHADAWRVGKEVLGALHHIHGRQRCYNDIKPSNVFLASSGAAHLGDFGAVRNIGGDADERTPAYLLKDQEPLSSFLATPAYDKLQLVMMLLDGVGAVDLEARHGERPSRRPDLEEVQKLAVELGADPVQSKLGVGSHLRTFLLEVMTGIVPEGSKVPVL